MTQAVIVSLTDRPDLADECTAWSYAEWGCLSDTMTLEGAEQYWRNLQDHGRLLEAYVALENDKPIGMAALKETEHPDREDLSPWLGSVYIHPKYRSKGHASALCGHVFSEAQKNFGYETLYLQTHIPEFYERMGCHVEGSVRDVLSAEKQDNILMSKKLSERNHV